MSSKKILLFLISVYAILGVVCLIFPKSGLALGSLTLNFPSLSDVAASLQPKAADKEPSPEELIAQRKAAVAAAEKDKFMEYMTKDPARIYFPGGKIETFDPFFAALDNAEKKPMRIIHYGDSQLEEDRISHTLRGHLQERFGGSGPGLQPFGLTRYTYSLSCTSTATLSRAAAFGTASRRSDGRYGVMGDMARLDTAIFVSYSSVKGNKTPSRWFNHVRILAGKLSGPLNISCNGVKQKIESVTDPSGVQKIDFQLKDSSTTARISMNGLADIYGVMLDGPGGVSLDNVAMRGCSGTIFTRINRDQLKAYYQGENVRMVILQYGGNSMPYCTTGKSISEYKSSIEKQILHIRKLAPNAAILFIGPSDMATTVKGVRQTYPHMEMMVDSLKAAANNTGAAYWDMYSAMGGNGSMIKWVKSNPPLAGTDYVHFTPRGAEAIGNMLYETLMVYYDYYAWRRKEGHE